MSSVRELARHPRLLHLRGRVRQLRDTTLDRQLVNLRRLIRELRREQADVVYFGESSLIHISPDDVDKRRLGEMVEARLGGAGRVAQFYGPAYSPTLFAETVRIISTLDVRPRAVVCPMAIRPSAATHVIEHPVFAYRDALAQLRTIDDARGRLPVRNRSSAPSPADYARYEALEVRGRWALHPTVGAYRQALRGYTEGPREIADQRILFDYFHGESAVDHPGLAAWAELGRQLSAYGVPVISYRTPVPMEVGESLFGQEFLDHVEANYQAVHDSFAANVSDLEVVDYRPLTRDDYLDPTDGTEHMNEHGRHAIADAVGDAVARRIAIGS